MMRRASTKTLLAGVWVAGLVIGLAFVWPWAIGSDVLAQQKPAEQKPAAAAPAKSPPAPAKQQQTQQQQPSPPVSTEQALYLIRSTILTLNDANHSGNYTVLRDLAAPDFQARYTAADLAASFTDLRRRNFDLYAVALTAPQLTASPRSMPTGCCGSPACFRRGRCRSTSIWCSRW